MTSRLGIVLALASLTASLPVAGQQLHEHQDKNGAVAPVPPTSNQQMPTREQQIAAATLALPEAFRAEATVQSVSGDQKITELRKGTSSMVCSIIEPGSKNFLAYCLDRAVDAYFYQQTQLQHELKRGGKPEGGTEFKAALQKEIESGRIKPPTSPSVGFMMGGPAKAFDWNTNTPSAEIKRWETIQIPNATGASLSLPNSRPANRGPWVMAEDTPGAHIMIEH